jgi:hypothetical protein
MYKRRHRHIPAEMIRKAIKNGFQIYLLIPLPKICFYFIFEAVPKLQFWNSL